MAFESVASMAQNKGDLPYVKFRWTTAGAGRGYISTAVTLSDPARVELEIDEQEKLIRLRGANGARSSIALGGSKSRGFALPKRAMIKIDHSERIPLALSDDGWWYGSYAK